MAEQPTTAECRAQYQRPGGRLRGDRIVYCGRPADHDGDHEETDTGLTWPPAKPLKHSYGDRVRTACTATGRYVCDGLALVVSAMDNSLFLDVATDADPHPDLPVPSDDALAGAFGAYTSRSQFDGGRRA